MISTYNIGIFLIIFSMPTTPTVMRPPTIASVLASNSVWTPSASAGASSSKAPSRTTTVSTSPSTTTQTNSSPAIGSIAYYTWQWMTLAQAQQARKDALAAQNAIDNPGFSSWVSDMEYDFNSMGNAASDYGITNISDYKTRYWSMYSPSGNAIHKTELPQKNNQVKTISPTISQKVQVGKLVSDFKVGLWSSGGDRAKYYNNINYDSLSPNAKVVADRLFDSKKKDDEPTPVAPVVTNRTGLKTVTPALPADSVAAIRAANPWMSVAEARAEAEKRRLSRVTTATNVTPVDKETTYIDETKNVIDTIKAQNEADKKAQIAAAEENKRLAEEYNNSMISEHKNALTTFENDQNALVSQYEGNRLNQVQWDLRRILLERWVDVSKVTPEQLIALSGSVWVNAFNDISAAKEKAKASVETARQNALAKISQLKANNVLNDSQYNTAVADINSKSAAANNNLDLKFAELKFGVATNKEATQKTDAQNAVANILSTAQALGVTGTQMGLVQQFIANAKTTPEALNRMLSELQNPNSPLYTTLKSSEDAAKKKAQFDAALKQYEAETDRMKAEAAVTSANRPRSSGSTTVVVPNAAWGS